MTKEPNWYNFADYLIEQFPERKQSIEETYFFWVDGHGNPYPHFFLEEFLIPILVGDAPDVELAARRKAGEVLDQILNGKDEDLAAAGLTSVVEMLRDEPALRSKAWPFLGPVARQWLQSV